MRVRLQQNLWNGDSPVDISLPEDWNVQIVRMPCDDQPVLSYDQVRERIENPLGTEPLSRQAAGRKRVCIVFDDISRATPSDVISQVVLDILLEAGVSKENIFFLCSPGSHGPHNSSPINWGRRLSAAIRCIITIVMRTVRIWENPGRDLISGLTASI